MQSKVYIAVSGCKRGFSILYTTPGLDTTYPGMAQSLCDMRQYLRISRPGTDWFGIDYIQGFRVCSVYRSTIDSAGSSGGFISVALVIPDDVSLASTRRLLTEMLEAYYTDHYNRQFGTPLPGKPETCDALEAILAAHAAEFVRMPVHYHPGVSDFNAPPLYVAACNDAVTDTIFASPYRSEYLRGAKLIMLPAAILAQPAAYSLTVNTDLATVNAVAGASDRLAGRMSAIVQHGCAVTSFFLNGTDVTASYSSVCLLPSDRISFSVLLPNAKATSFDGTVQQALASRTLLAVRDRYGFNFFPFDVAVSVRGLVGGIPRENILMPAVVSQNGVMPLTVNARGEGHFTVKTPFNTAALALVASNGAKVLVSHSFLSADSDLRAVYPIDLRPLTIRYPRIAKGKASLGFDHAAFPLDITPDPLTVLLPASLQGAPVLYIGKVRWKINPVTGACDSQNDGKGGAIPLWIWGVVAAAVLAIGGAIWYFTSHRNAPAPKTDTIAKTKDSAAKDSDNIKDAKAIADPDDVDDEGFTEGMNPDGTPADDEASFDDDDDDDFEPAEMIPPRRPHAIQPRKPEEPKVMPGGGGAGNQPRNKRVFQNKR